MGAKFNYTRPPITAYQEAIIDSEARFTVTEAGTKTGKTASHVIWSTEEALKLKRGQHGWWVAPVFSQAEIAFNRMRNQFEPKGILKINESKLSIMFPNGGIMQFKSGEKPDNLFGEDVYFAVFDEFTRAREEAWFALRSTLTATNGKCKLIGNAKGKKNWGYKLGVRAKNGEPGYEYHKITAWDAVAAGILDRAEVEQAMRDLPEAVFRELYLAEASEDGSNPFGLDAIRRNVKPLSTKPVKAFGIDLAKYSDWTVIVGLDEDGNVCYFERFQKPWGETQEHIIRVVGQNPCYIDSTGVGDPIVEYVAKKCHRVQGINYASGNRQKQQLMEGLAGAITRNECSVLAGVMQDEMESFEFEYSQGRVKYSAPSGGHDDCVNALALAWDCKIHNPKGIFVFA